MQVTGPLDRFLGKFNFYNKHGASRTTYAFMMKAETMYDNWAESVRYRVWVSRDMAALILRRLSGLTKQS